MSWKRKHFRFWTLWRPKQQVSQACSPDSARDRAAADLDKRDSAGKPNLDSKGPRRWLTTRRSLVTILWLWHEIGMTAQEVGSIVLSMGGWGIWGVQRRRCRVA
jgi:hypothetical protein